MSLLCVCAFLEEGSECSAARYDAPIAVDASAEIMELRKRHADANYLFEYASGSRRDAISAFGMRVSLRARMHRRETSFILSRRHSF